MPYGGTIFSTVNADLVQTDVDSIVQGLTGPGGMTFTDVQDRLNLGLFYFGMMPWMEMIRYYLDYYLYNSMWGWEPWLQTSTTTSTTRTPCSPGSRRSTTTSTTTSTTG